MFGGIDEGTMIERIGIGLGAGLDLDQGQELDLSIDQGHVLVHAQKGKVSERSLKFVSKVCPNINAYVGSSICNIWHSFLFNK